ncbi:MAG: gliding motility-associated C-terminal domain-containing protein [Limnobacter sp.]|uniref:T9SS type B sorting domain-containing protein n=1 Tax=Limnobacter sp. TaxID=2003368 RepID=UPI0032EFFBC2
MDTNNVFWNDSASWWEGNFGVATRFSWKTDCNHLAQVNACFTKSNTYNFVFKVLDNWCPAPGMNFQTFAVTVIAPPAVDPPELKCAKVMGNGDVLLSWMPNILRADDTLNSFRRYVIYRSDSGASGPYDTLHSVFDIDSLQYLDVGANATASAKYYVIQGISSCNDQGVAIWSDTISGMRLTAQVFNSGNSVALNWNDYSPGNRFGSQTTGEYYVWQILNGDTSIIDTTLESWDTLQINLCYPSNVEYMITVLDTTTGYGCESNSTISGGTVGDNLAPDPIILDEVSYDANNNVVLNWQATSPDIGMYYIYKGGVLIDSLPFGVNTYNYTPGGTDPCVMNFSIQAKDTCDNMNTVGIAQSSMCMSIDDVILCDTNKRALISWNNYNPSWANGSGYILIYRSDNGGAYQLVDSIPGGNSSFADTSINQLTYYRYRMVSKESGTVRSAVSAWDSVTVGRFIRGGIMESPDLRCVSWLNDSTLRLTWKQPPIGDTNLNRYMIYHSTSSGGPFSVIDSVGGLLTSDHKAYDSLEYTHMGATGGSHYYYVLSKSGCDGQQPSVKKATLRSINLQVSSISDSVNQLDWNPVSTTQLSPSYTVWRDAAIIGNTPYGTESMEDTWVVCNQAVNYQVRYPDGTGYCDSRSKNIDASFVDDTPPAKQFLDSVSMRRDTTFTAMVGWGKNPSSDVARYYVMECTPGSYKILDTLSAASPRFFTDNLNAPLGDITRYTVMAEDSCGNNSLSQQNFDCHSTMFVNAVMDFCDQSILLEWNPYDAFISGLPVSYDIYVSENGAPFVEVGKSDAPKYKYSDLTNGNNYCFYIQGWDNSGAGPFSSSSAVVCLDAVFINEPDFAYMRYASVEDTNLVRMCMKIDLESDIGEYWVKRSNKPDEGYRVIATVELPDPLTPADSNFCFDDVDVNTNQLSYYYKIDVVDPCGEVGISTNLARTILLDVRADNDQNKNVLTWNTYRDWEGRVAEYEVWRGSSVANLKKVRSLPVSQFSSISDVSQKGDMITFVDDVAGEGSKGSGQFCYVVYAKEGTATFQNIEPAVSRSNVVCAVQNPLFYVPTAFTPNGDGKNDYFKPLGSFHDVRAYNLEVYNRWGERIYSTDNYDSKGWDGGFKGTESPEGVYVYIVRYTSAEGQEYEKRGSVALTRPTGP